MSLPTGHHLTDIIQGCIKAKRESQLEFYKQYYGFFMGVSMRYCKNTDDAVDVTNNAFLKVFNSINKFVPKYENTEASLVAWLKSIVINTAIDYCRKNYNKYLGVEITEAYFVSDENANLAEDRLSYKDLLHIVQKLSPAYKTVFNLYVIDGYKHEEIAKHLNISVGTSKSNLAKARMNLQKILIGKNEELYEQRKAI